MKTFKDVFSSDELFSDTYKMKLVDNVMYEVIGKYETRKEGKVDLEGHFGFCSGYEATTSGIDIVLNQKLIKTGFEEKKHFSKYLMFYREKVLKYLEENDRKDEIDEFKSNINKVMKELLVKYRKFEFFVGPSKDYSAMIVMCEYKNVDGEERPVLMFFKHGLEELANESDVEAEDPDYQQPEEAAANNKEAFDDDEVCSTNGNNKENTGDDVSDTEDKAKSEYQPEDPEKSQEKSKKEAKLQLRKSKPSQQQQQKHRDLRDILKEKRKHHHQQQQQLRQQQQQQQQHQQQQQQQQHHNQEKKKNRSGWVKRRAKARTAAALAAANAALGGQGTVYNNCTFQFK